MSDPASPTTRDMSVSAMAASVTDINPRSFRNIYQLHKPRGDTKPHYQLQIPSSDGLQVMPSISGSYETKIAMLMNSDEAEVGRYLWTFREADEAIALETCQFAHNFPGGKIKHTNLTGNGAAYCGGELWLSSPDRIVMNGSSGRYRTQSEEQLSHAGLVLKGYGFCVGVMRFLSNGKPRDIIEREEDLLWL